MRLVSVYENQVRSARTLYVLLEERPGDGNISHAAMPTWEEHKAFIASRPFLLWLMIEHEGEYVGAIEANDRNEFGVSILQRYQRWGLGSAALKLFMDTHKPLPAAPAIRNGCWLANVAPGNKPAHAFFEKHGFRLIQETLVR